MAQQVSQNTFIRGLQMDTSPMQLDSATLSNALNATLVTMNGNEVILLNDMGNARVDNAYLPSGYVPIGMKEYGGVIYVAAYNPITNKGQVGSFPSPERKFGAEYSALISGDIDIDNFFDTVISSINKEFTFEGLSAETNLNNIEDAIKTNTILVPLIKNYSNNTTNIENLNIENLNIIRAGDKFSIYDSEEYILENGGIKQYLSNFDNVNENDNALYLKNNIITFSVGVLNSQNEFVDITPSLKRFKNNKIIEKESSVDAFNIGYFITSSKPEGGSNPDDTTSDDKKLIEERNKYAVNTYGQKLVGPLYLKMQLNVIEDFEYAIYGNKNINSGETTYDIFIVSYYKYNFPDGVFTENKDLKNLLNQGYKNNCLLKKETSSNSDAYIYKKYGPFTYSEIKWKQTGEGTEIESKSLLKKSPDINDIQYNTASNLYSASSTLKIEGQSFGDASTIGYTLLPGLTFGGMKELKATGILDLTKLGTGVFEINNWRYYNADGQFTLTYGWESYPKYGERISNVKFEFVDIYKSKLSASWNPQLVEYTYSLEERDSYNGLFTNTFILEDCNLNSNTLYLVRITADVLGATSASPKVEYRFILTTELFNDCYFIGSESFIKDYGKPKNNGGAIFPNYDNEEEVYSGEALIYHNKLKVNFDFDINYEDYGSSSEELYGNLASKSGENIEYGYVKKYNINLKLNYNLHIVNPDYYPTIILEIEPLTTGALFLPKELVPSSSEAPPRQGDDFDSPEGPNSTTNTSTGKKLYFIDTTLNYSGGTISSGSTGGSGGITTYYEYDRLEEDLSASELQENLDNIDQRLINLILDKSIPDILEKIGYKEETTDWDDFTLEELTKPNITFDSVTGNIYGSLSIYDKCIAQTELYENIQITNPFRSIYDHLETIFSMYNGRLFGYILQSSNKSKNIASVSNVDVTKNHYYFPSDFPSGSDRTGNGQRRPEDFKPDGTNDDRSYLMTFNSAKNSDSDLYEKISGVKNSNRNTVLNMSIKKRVLTVQEKWANNNPLSYSIVGMLNADYLNKTTENWSEELAAKSNLSLFCWIWWKTTDPLVFALFPVMWFNDKIGVDHAADPDANKDQSELAERGQRYKYNTTLSESIGDYSDDDNIFKKYLQEFVFTFGGKELFNLYLTDEGNYTKVKTLYNAILQILASIKIDTPNIKVFYDTINANLSNIYSANLFEFWKEEKIEKNLEEDYSIKFPSSNKVDELLQESREISNGNADGIDVSGGRVYDAYGRHLDSNSIYLADENGALKANRDLANYFDIDTEKKTISIESSKINYLPLSRVCRYMSWQSRTGELKNNVKSDAINCFPRMNVEGSVFKTLDDDTNKHWVKV